MNFSNVRLVGDKEEIGMKERLDEGRVGLQEGWDEGKIGMKSGFG